LISRHLGFYISAEFFPTPRVSKESPLPKEQLLLGPFCGKPACQFIQVGPDNARGVCAAAFVKRETVLVPDVEAYPGHIACDGETKSEIVCPLLLEQDGKVTALGVLDLDCLALNGFEEEDRVGLEKIAKLVVSSSDW
jgi:L-methionine (R)-S-oxide reductase